MGIVITVDGPSGLGKGHFAMHWLKNLVLPC